MTKTRCSVISGGDGEVGGGGGDEKDGCGGREIAQRRERARTEGGEGGKEKGWWEGKEGRKKVDEGHSKERKDGERRERE